MSSHTNLQRLREAGYFIKTPLPAEYEQVIEELSENEIAALISVKERFDEAQAGTEAHVPPYTMFIGVPY